MPRWTAEARADQRARIRQTRPWDHSTGPRTAAGKGISRANATRHGLRSAAYRDLVAALREQAAFVRAVRRAHARPPKPAQTLQSFPAGETGMSFISHASPFFGPKPSAGNAANLAKTAGQSLTSPQSAASNAGSPFAAILNPQVQQALTTAANTAKGVTTPAAAPAAAAVPTGTTGAVHALTLQGLVAGGVNYNSDFKSGLFQVADANHDGLVTKTELEQQVVGGGGTVDEADSLYAAVGGHAGSRGVTLQQFNISLATPNDNNFGDQLFKTLDTNGDGIVGTAELKTALQSMGDSTQQKQGVTARYAATAAGGMIRSDLTDPA